MLLFVGLFLAFPGIVQAALTLALIAAVILQVRIEERVLEASLGEPYRRYRSRVRRWLGTYRRARPPRVVKMRRSSLTRPESGFP